MQDVSELVALANDLEILKFQAPIPYPLTEEYTLGWVRKCEQDQKTKPRLNYAFAIEMQEERTLIGGIGLGEIDRYPGTATLGYWIGKDHWNNGYATEAIRGMVDLGFGDLDLGRINAEVDTENGASCGILVKLGFELEGTRRRFTKVASTGKWADYNMYGLLK